MLCALALFAAPELEGGGETKRKTRNELNGRKARKWERHFEGGSAAFDTYFWGEGWVVDMRVRPPRYWKKRAHHLMRWSNQR